MSAFSSVFTKWNWMGDEWSYYYRLDDDDGLMPPPSRRTHFRNALSFYRYLMSTASADMATTRSTSRLS